jgi:hypothetical protein
MIPEDLHYQERLTTYNPDMMTIAAPVSTGRLMKAGI